MSGCKSYYGAGSWLASAILAALCASACGDDFESNDCKATRTCMGPAQAGQGGEPSRSSGGEAGRDAGGQGGAGDAGPECTAAVDCANGDARDGVEACVNGACRPGNPPPRVTAVSPTDGAESAEPGASIVVEFSEALDPETVTSESVQILDGETPVPGTLSYKDSVATFVAEVPFTLLASYEVRVTEEVADLAGAALLEAHRSTFSVRDGSWHVIDLEGKLSSLAPSSPLTSDGSLLLAWSGNGVETCPTFAAWLGLEQTKLTPQPFTQAADYCYSTLAAAVDGTGVVSWNGSGISYAQLYDDEAWQEESLQVTASSESYVSLLGASPLGVVTRFVDADAGGLTAVRTGADGTWESSPDVIAEPQAIYPTAPERVGFDREGNGVVAFLARDSSSTRQQMMVSRYTVARGKWGAAVAIPGSAGEPNEAFGDRSVPVVDVAPTGEALVVWSEGPYPGRLMSSYFDPDDGWSAAELVSGTVKVVATELNHPRLTYDGERFVAAWLGEPDDGVRRVFTARYDVAEGWASPEGHDAKRTLPAVEQPQVASDHHGNLLLLWRTGSPGMFPWVQQRLVAGEWTTIELLPGDPMKGLARAKTTLQMNESGMAAITWPVEDEQNHYVAIHVARFY